MNEASSNDSPTDVAETTLFQVAIPVSLLVPIKAAARDNERSASREIVYALRQRYEVTA